MQCVLEAACTYHDGIPFVCGHDSTDDERTNDGIYQWCRSTVEMSHASESALRRTRRGRSDAGTMGLMGSTRRPLRGCQWLSDTIK